MFCQYSKRSSKGIHYATINVKPQEKGGGMKVTTPGKLTYKAVPWVGTLNIHGALII